MQIASRLFLRRISIVQAIAIAACFATATANAQPTPSKEMSKDAKAKVTTKKDDAKAVRKTEAKRADLKTSRPAEIHAPVGRRNPQQIPEPTVKLKPGEVPAIKFDQPNYDFGRIRAGNDVQHTYYFTNTGTGPLEILRVKPSCGCTTAGNYTKIVKPGETGQIPIKVATHKGSGPLSKSVTVNTNVPGADSTLRLSIRGEVWQPVQVTPPSAAFGRITSDQATDKTQRKLTIINNIEGALKPGNIQITNNHFKAEVKPVEAGKKYELIVSLVPPLQDGNNTGKITIDTGIDNPKSIDVPVYAYLTSPVDVTPTQLTLMSGRTAPMKRQFYIRCHDNKPFDITDLKCSSDAVKLSINDMRGSRMTYQLVADIPADYAPPAGGDRITFRTTHPAQPSMSIPIVERTPYRRSMTLKPGANMKRGLKVNPRPIPGKQVKAPQRKVEKKPEAKKPDAQKTPQKMTTTNAPKG